MTLPRILSASVFIAASLPASADGYDADALLYLHNTTAQVTAQTATDSLKAAAQAHPDLEWKDGAEGEADSMVMLSDVLFEFGDATLSPDAERTLASIVKDLAGVPGIQITGHTDSIGTEQANEQLAKTRADAVRDWLIEFGEIDATLLTSISKGEAQPIAANVLTDGRDNPEGRSLNRRVEFHMLQEQATAATAQITEPQEIPGAL